MRILKCEDYNNIDKYKFSEVVQIVYDDVIGDVGLLVILGVVIPPFPVFGFFLLDAYQRYMGALDVVGFLVVGIVDIIGLVSSVAFLAYLHKVRNWVQSGELFKELAKARHMFGFGTVLDFYEGVGFIMLGSLGIALAFKAYAVYVHGVSIIWRNMWVDTLFLLFISAAGADRICVSRLLSELIDIVKTIRNVTDVEEVLAQLRTRHY